MVCILLLCWVPIHILLLRNEDSGIHKNVESGVWSLKVVNFINDILNKLMCAIIWLQPYSDVCFFAPEKGSFCICFNNETRCQIWSLFPINVMWLYGCLSDVFHGLAADLTFGSGYWNVRRAGSRSSLWTVILQTLSPLNSHFASDALICVLKILEFCILFEKHFKISSLSNYFF